ncbi:unnamed protein product, partial [Iphiclides podalirius]
MPPPFGHPSYEFEEPDDYEQKGVEDSNYFGLTDMALWYTAVLVAMLLLWMLMFFCLRIISLSTVEYSTDNDEKTDEVITETLQDVIIFIVCCFVALLIIVFSLTVMRMLLLLGQKTRSPQQRRQYLGSRARPSIPEADPAVYVSPANLPPPPKYEAMAPPSYDEVVGVHYPNFQQSQVQPIATPIAVAMAQNATATATTSPAATTADTTAIASPPTTLTVTNERAPAVTAVSS